MGEKQTNLHPFSLVYLGTGWKVCIAFQGQFTLQQQLSEAWLKAPKYIYDWTHHKLNCRWNIFKKNTGDTSLKPLHNIGKVSVNASILYKNQEICNKTNLWKFQLISLFILRENSKNAFSIFVFIPMAGIFVSRDENSLLDLISLIIRKR